MSLLKSQITINGKEIGSGSPVYFIADIAANHDGDLSRAIDLIHLAAEAGADAAKFQHFQAETIVSDLGFKSMSSQSHQASWKKPVFEVYKDASLNPEWTPILKEECGKAGIEFMTSPYSPELVDIVDPYLNAYKIGSGDITYTEILEHIARKGKPVILATGAATMGEVEKAVQLISGINPNLVLMQCNTNYTAKSENFNFVNLNVLRSYAKKFPGVILGLSDHTKTCSTVLGAVALGAVMIEKHFTDDNDRVGPDHVFSITPGNWREMVERTRELEAAMGDGVKKVEANESGTIVVQRRAVRVIKDLKAGSILQRSDLTCLRPCPEGAVNPNELELVIGKQLNRDIKAEEHLSFSDLN
jgi:N-acetylneuraminate synthase